MCHVKCFIIVRIFFYLLQLMNKSLHCSTLWFFSNCSSVSGNKLILNVWKIIGSIDAIDLGWGWLQLAPLVDLESQVLVDNLGVSVSDGDDGTLLEEVNLFVSGEKDNGAPLITNNYLSLLDLRSIVSLSVLGQLNWLDLKGQCFLDDWFFEHIVNISCIYYSLPSSACWLCFRVQATR